MYHNSATPPLPACYGDTCEPHQHLNMLSRTAEYTDVYRYIDIDDIDGPHINGPHMMTLR